MSLIKSISGIRGTIGGVPGDGLDPLSVVRFTAAYATFILQNSQRTDQRAKIVVGRDARISGAMVDKLVSATLMGMGLDVINIGLATTPTTEIAVTGEHASGGIIITASHNPKHWNALKLLNAHGEFLNDEQGKQVLKIAEDESFIFADVEHLGTQINIPDYAMRHVQQVLALPLVNAQAIKDMHLTVAIDCVNSVGGIALPLLLHELGVENIVELNTTPDGHFAHNPEPLPQNLTEIAGRMRQGGIDVGFVVDPDVDRLAIICENGDMFGEEYTLVATAQYVLSHTPGNTVSNMSSTRALADITSTFNGCHYSSAPVGEVNVVTEMKRSGAVIGGEGNGGVIYPALHYGRDALVGIALFLSLMAEKQQKPSLIRASLPDYHISKNRIDLTEGIDVDALLTAVKGIYKMYHVDDRDGVKIEFQQGWVHLRKSNTEPIIRVYSEAQTEEQADKFAQAIIAEIKRIANIK
ncbi:MAG TPA: phosphoglucosamine mutase [Bacteroidales bacterium]|nr:phosphoglucosamine mutase [Bacteroidales bacterium]